MTVHGLLPGTLRPSEVITHCWAAPGGRGLLTNLRCVLLGHPLPIRRSVRWSVNLEAVNQLLVDRVRGVPSAAFLLRGAFGGGRVSVGGADQTLCVMVNKTIVYVGDPDPCADLQRRIDDARTARCLALYGRLVPFEPGPPIHEDFTAAQQEDELPPTPAAVTSAVAGSPFLLFIAGEPFQDAVPNARNPRAFAAGAGRVGVSDSLGGHEPADALPGQIYGAQAALARMVLEIARKCGVSVHVINVDHSGADLRLVEKMVSPNDDLPLLVRYDGARLAGFEAMVPVKVVEFLQRR